MHFKIIASSYIWAMPRPLRSRDVTGHVTIWYSRCQFLYVLHHNRVCISSSFRHNGPRFIGVIDFYLSRLHDVIDHVTNRFAVCNFLLVTHWNWASVTDRFWDIWPQIVARTRTQTHTQTHATSDFYIVPCNVLHSTDNNYYHHKQGKHCRSNLSCQ